MILMAKEEALNQFLKRFKTSLSFQSSFPKIKESISNDLNFSDHHITALCKLAGISNAETNHFGMSIVSLAATGWIITEGTETRKPIFKCNSCQRSVMCGSFSLLDPYDSLRKENKAKPDIAEPKTEAVIQDKSEDAEESSTEPPSKRKRISFVIKKGEPFDPLHEHRPWCLWIYNGMDDYISTPINDKSNASSGIPGWKIFIKSLLRNISDSQDLGTYKSPSREQIRNVKNLLEKWTDAM